MATYPPDAYIDETLWWRLSKWPKSKRTFGDEPRIAAWLAFNKVVGDTFTTTELRDALGDRLSPTSRNNNEHFQRRIRELRRPSDGWIFPSIKHDRTLQVGEYRLDKIGWHPALGPRPKPPNIVSAKTKRLVLARDGSRCILCGVGTGEPYPGRLDSAAVMTVGHVHAGIFGGSSDISNLRTECSECNEGSRSDTGTPETSDSVLATIQNFKTEELKRLHGWATAGQRSRDRVDQAFDRIRALSPGDRDKVLSQLHQMLGRTV